jgi:predicted nucleotidyltransferase
MVLINTAHGMREKPPEVTEEAMRQAVEAFARRPEVMAAYLFGSYATGRVTPMSDIDFAVLVSNAFSRERYLDYQLALLGDLCGVFRSDEVQVVMLNEAPPLLAYKVMVEGRPLFCRDEVARLRFRVHATRRYLDTKPLRQVQAEATARRIREGRFGHRP